MLKLNFKFCLQNLTLLFLLAFLINVSTVNADCASSLDKFKELSVKMIKAQFNLDELKTFCTDDLPLLLKENEIQEGCVDEAEKKFDIKVGAKNFKYTCENQESAVAVHLCAAKHAQDIVDKCSNKRVCESTDCMKTLKFEKCSPDERESLLKFHEDMDAYSSCPDDSSKSSIMEHMSKSCYLLTFLLFMKYFN